MTSSNSQEWVVAEAKPIPYGHPHQSLTQRIRKVRNTILWNWAYRCPLNGLRILFHRMRGVHIGKGVYIGRYCFLDNMHPEYIYIDDVAKLNDPIQNSCEKKIVMLKANIDSVGGNAFVRKLSRFIKALFAQILHYPMGVYRYSKIRKKLSGPVFAEEDVIPTLLPNWDNTPRRAEGAMVLHEATPEQFYKHCKETFEYVRNKENKVVFLKSWNEWGEGNYMEPCIQYCHGYIDALRRALEELTGK